MLKEVMALYRLTFMQVLVNFVQTVLAVDTLMHQQWLTFSASDLLNVYIMVHPNSLRAIVTFYSGIPANPKRDLNELFQKRLGSEELSAELNEGTVLAKNLDLNQGITLSSSSFMSSDSLDNEEEGEEVNQLVLNRRRREQPTTAFAILVVIPILVSSLKAKDSDNLAFTLPQPVGEDVIAHCYFKGAVQVQARVSNPSSRSQIFITKLGKQVIMVDSTKDNNTSLALAQADMLPNDDLTMERSEKIQDLLALGDLDELEKVVCGSVYERVFNWESTELETTMTSGPEVEQLDPHQPYSPLVLSDFNEEEYFKEHANEELERFAEVADAGGNPVLNAVGTSATSGGAFEVDAPLNM
ncbi:hypothetical protein Acr_12g0003250 [Actinidia rufa]|uniref:Uncharacterized protein n=1 Tax=Actinidia rufa TaxID=165716 RepID=A0A7J0FGF2_9ERIC|nr:hypothetical protein Acr_12g0003250 [Actinidia rufa]